MAIRIPDSLVLRALAHKARGLGSSLGPGQNFSISIPWAARQVN